MVGEMSSILRDLEVVQDRLSSLARNADDEKLALLARREELTNQAARLADDVKSNGSTQELLTQLATLRRRREDLPALVSFFLEHYNEVNDRYVVHLGPGVMEAMQDYPNYRKKSLQFAVDQFSYEKIGLELQGIVEEALEP